MPPNMQLQRTVEPQRMRARAHHFIMRSRRASHGSARPLNCGVRRHCGVAHRSGGIREEHEMERVLLAGCAALAPSLLAFSAYADCMAKGFLKHDFPRNPIYEVVACGPAEPVVELLRQSDPGWFGTFSYSDADVVITVKAANDDARKLMWRDIEYWYFPSGCTNVRAGMRFVRPELRELCCDVRPVRDLPCGVGGKQLLRI